jgi:hypothetical protein
MNETQINAQFAALVDQRNAAQNNSVNLIGELAVANAKIKELEKQLEAATALVSDNATEVEESNV